MDTKVYIDPENGSRTSYVVGVSNSYKQEIIEEINDFIKQYGKTPNKSKIEKVGSIEDYKERLLDLFNKASNSKLIKFCTTCTLLRYVNLIVKYSEYGTKLLKIEGVWKDENEVEDIVESQEIISEEIVQEVSQEVVSQETVKPKRKRKNDTNV